MKKVFIIVAIIVVAFALSKVFRAPAETPTAKEEPLAESVSSAKDAVERVATSVASKEGENRIATSVGSGEVPKDTALKNENIRVTSPKPDAVLASPFAVSGEARVFENIVSVRVTNTNGDMLIEETAYARSPDAGEWGPFTINLTYQFKNTRAGFVEVYHASAKDGSEEDLIRIPVKFE